jgi:GxxExxY protein
VEQLNLVHIPYQREIPIIIRSVDTQKPLGNYRLDFVVDEKVVVEMKAIKFTPVKMEQQLYAYLRNSVYEIGLMINFGSSKHYIRRVILTNDHKQLP